MAPDSAGTQRSCTLRIAITSGFYVAKLIVLLSKAHACVFALLRDLLQSGMANYATKMCSSLT